VASARRLVLAEVCSMLTWIVGVAVLLAGGLLGAANLIVAKKPDAKAMIEKNAPYQGIVGIVMMAWGVWLLIGLAQSLAHLSFSVEWMVGLFAMVVDLGLGFLLAFGLISRYVLEKNAQAKEKGEDGREKGTVTGTSM